MGNSHRIALVLVVVGMTAVVSSCSKRSSNEREGGPPSDLVLGRVAGQDFTVADLEKKLKYQFASQLQGVSGAQAAEQHRDIVQSALDELCWVRMGEKKGYMNDPAFQDTWELSRRYILARQTIEHEVTAYEASTEEEVVRYYEENPDQFILPTRVQLAHVQVRTKAEAEAVRHRLERGEPLGKVAAEVSIDQRTRLDGGVLGWITETSGTGHLGKIPAVNEVAMKLQKGEVSSPVPLPVDKTWTVLVALDRTEEGPRPLDDSLREAIRKRVQTGKHNERFSAVLGDLKREYAVEFNEENYERYAASLMSEEELFDRAQRSKDPQGKIRSYRSILAVHPDSRFAPQAQFMIGFTLSDELKDYAQARDEFRRFLLAYPDHDLVEAARWMLENMEEPDPDPDELNEVRRKARTRPQGS